MDEKELLTRAFQMLSEILNDGEGMELIPYPGQLPDAIAETAWQVAAPGHATPLLVQAFTEFAPRDADRVLRVSPVVRTIMRDPPMIVVAPWLSARSRDLLTERGINYIDLTGNIQLRVARPAIRVRLDGAQQNPQPRSKPTLRLRGTSVNALVRLLVDVAPPYRMVDLARVTGLSNAYVSRTLEALHEEGVIERPPESRVVVDVDWPALLRARASQYSLLGTNEYKTFIARPGANALVRRLAEQAEDQAVVTGSFAAIDFVQLAAPAQLVLYVPNIDDLAERYSLLPAKQGADVVLLRAADSSQLDRPGMTKQGAPRVGLSQLALDCLSGNGRLPEEGSALIEWMAAHVSAWREPALDDLPLASRRD
jgi:hypothetical protein